MDIANFLRKAAAWLCALLLVFFLSSSIITYAFVARFFDPQVYFSSFEKRGVYSSLRDSLSSLLASGLPPEARAMARPELDSAITGDYVQNQTESMVSSLLLYLSSQKSELTLSLDLSPVRAKFSGNPDPGVQILGLALPPSIDLAQQAASSGQLAPLESLRSQIAGLKTANGAGFAFSALLLIPVFLLQPEWQEGVRQCCRTVFSCGLSTAIGGMGMALLSGPLLQLLLSSATQNAEIASAVAGILGDVLWEAGILTALLSLPLMAAGFAVPRLLPARNP